MAGSSLGLSLTSFLPTFDNFGIAASLGPTSSPDYLADAPFREPVGGGPRHALPGSPPAPGLENAREPSPNRSSPCPRAAAEQRPQTPPRPGEAVEPRDHLRGGEGEPAVLGKSTAAGTETLPRRAPVELATGAAASGGAQASPAEAPPWGRWARMRMTRAPAPPAPGRGPSSGLPSECQERLSGASPPSPGAMQPASRAGASPGLGSSLPSQHPTPAAKGSPDGPETRTNGAAERQPLVGGSARGTQHEADEGKGQVPHATEEEEGCFEEDVVVSGLLKKAGLSDAEVKKLLSGMEKMAQRKLEKVKDKGKRGADSGAPPEGQGARKKLRELAPAPADRAHETGPNIRAPDPVHPPAGPADAGSGPPLRQSGRTPLRGQEPSPGVPGMARMGPGRTQVFMIEGTPAAGRPGVSQVSPFLSGTVQPVAASPQHAGPRAAAGIPSQWSHPAGTAAPGSGQPGLGQGQGQGLGQRQGQGQLQGQNPSPGIWQGKDQSGQGQWFGHNRAQDSVGGLAPGQGPAYQYGSSSGEGHPQRQGQQAWQVPQQAPRQGPYQAQGQGHFHAQGQGPPQAPGQGIHQVHGQPPLQSQGLGPYQAQGQAPPQPQGQGTWQVQGQGPLHSAGQAPVQAQAQAQTQGQEQGQGQAQGQALVLDPKLAETVKEVMRLLTTMTPPVVTQSPAVPGGTASGSPPQAPRGLAHGGPPLVHGVTPQSYGGPPQAYVGPQHAHGGPPQAFGGAASLYTNPAAMAPAVPQAVPATAAAAASHPGSGASTWPHFGRAQQQYPSAVTAPQHIAPRAPPQEYGSPALAPSPTAAPAIVPAVAGAQYHTALKLPTDQRTGTPMQPFGAPVRPHGPGQGIQHKDIEAGRRQGMHGAAWSSQPGGGQHMQQSTGVHGAPAAQPQGSDAARRDHGGGSILVYRRRNSPPGTSNMLEGEKRRPHNESPDKAGRGKVHLSLGLGLGSDVYEPEAGNKSNCAPDTAPAKRAGAGSSGSREDGNAALALVNSGPAAAAATGGSGGKLSIPRGHEDLWALLKETGMSGNEASEVLRELAAMGHVSLGEEGQGSGMVKSIPQDHVVKVLDILDRYWVKGARVRSVIRAQPAILAMNLEALDRALLALAESGVTRDKLGYVLATSQALKDEGPASLVAKLDFISHLGVTSVRLILEHCPWVLSTPLAAMRQNVELLVDTVGEKDLGKVLEQSPSMLEGAQGASVIVNFLLRDCGVSKEQASLILQRKAFVRGTTLEALKARLDALLEIADLSDIPEILQREPGILSAGMDTIVYNRARLCELMPEAEAKSFVVKYPRVLRFNWDQKVQPIVEYLTAACRLSPSEVLWAGVFAYSLDKAIKPRISFLVEHNVKVVASRKHKKDEYLEEPDSGEAVCLSSAVMMSQSAFVKRFGSGTRPASTRHVKIGEETLEEV